MPAGEYLEGLFFLAATLTATGAVGVVSARRLGYSGAPLACAIGVFWLAALLAAHLIPAVLGVLTRESALAAALLIAGAAYRWGPRRTVPAPPAPAAPGGALSWAIAGAASVAVFGQFLLYLTERAAVPVRAFDALTFHLPSVARWIDSGTVWQLDNLYPDYAFGNYPQNGDFLQLTAVLPFGNDAFARLVGYPLLLLTAVSVYALACELRAPRATAVTFASALVAVPVALLPALEEAQVDPLMFAGFGCGLLFLVRHARTGDRSDLVLAGLGLGLAFGSKWYALPYVAVTVGLWVAARLALRRPRGLVARDAGLVGGLVLAAGGLWLVRNLVESSNPLFPLKIEVAGLTIFNAPRDTIREQIGFPLIHYAGDPSVINDFVFPSWANTFQTAGPLLIAGTVAAVVMCLAEIRRTEPGRRPLRVLFCATLVLVLALVFAATPNTALGPEGEPIHMGAAARYAVPVLMLGAAVSAWVAGRLARARPLAEAAALAATIDGLARTFEFSAGPAVLAGAAAAGLIGAGALLLRHPPAVPTRRSAVAVVAGCGLLAATGAAYAGHRLQVDFNDHRYVGSDPVIDEIAVAGPSRRIAITGNWSDRGLSPVLPAFGARLANEVDYVGPLVGGMLRRPRDPREFAADLRRGRYDLLVVGRGGPPPRQLREERWALDQGFVEVGQSERFTLLRPAGSR
jgi:hypothetical protein